MKPITEKEFNHLVEFVKTKYGINLLHKKTLIVSRLQNNMIQNNFDSFSEYYEFIISDKTGKATSELINKLTTNHTFFMREPDHFRYFQKSVLPYLQAIESERKDLRIWSAGCSTGEEPYTLAMILDDYFGHKKNFWDTKILATDISTKVLQTAVDGIYPREGIEQVPQEWRKKYFTSVEDESSMVTGKIKNEVIFKKFNLMEELFPFRHKFHVIFCRNVMIYFDSKTRDKLVNKFYDVMEQGGYLFIGHSESLNRETAKFDYVRPAVYRKD